MRESSDRPKQSHRSGPTDDPAVVIWSPSGVVTSMWVAMGIMLGLLGFFLFGLAYVLVGASPAGDTLEWNPLIVAGLSVAALVAHQLIHAGVGRSLGGRPRLDLDVVQLIFPVMYVRCDNKGFSRTQFITYALAPLVLMSSIGVLAMSIDSRGAMLIIPLAINAGLSMRDLWTALVVWRQPGGSMVEMHGSDLRIIRPL